MKSEFKNLTRFLKLVFKYKKWHVVAAFFMLCSAGSLLFLPYLTMNMIDGAIKGQSFKWLIQLVGLYILIAIIQNGCKIISDYMYSAIGKRMVLDLRLTIIKHLFKLPGRFHSDMQAGEMITILNHDTAAVEDLSTKMIFSVLSELCTAFGMFLFLLYLQPDLLLLTLLLQPVLLVTQKGFSKRISTNMAQYRNHLGQFSIDMQQFVPSVIDILMLKGKSFFIHKLFSNFRSMLRLGIKLQFLFSTNVSVAGLIGTLTTAMIFGYGGYKVISGTLTIGGLIAFNQYAQRLLGPIIQMVQINTKFRQSMVSVNRIFQFLDQEMEIKRIKGGAKPDIIGHVAFDHVYFCYTEKKPVLCDINLQFRTGEITAIVGESGSGKSTLSALLMRFWDPCKGNIYIDGKEIRDYNLYFLRKWITVVSQDGYFFHDTILNNLKLSNPNVREKDIIEAVKKVDLYSFIMTLPDQFNTMIGDRGSKLSGGQKQRLALARAYLHPTPIVIFDEATSAMDTITEAHVCQELYRTLSNRTIIVIAHRLSTITQADMIYVLRDGKVAEQGKHVDLFEQKGYYYELYMKSLNAAYSQS